jgi:hypothetical protein
MKLVSISLPYSRSALAVRSGLASLASREIRTPGTIQPRLIEPATASLLVAAARQRFAPPLGTVSRRPSGDWQRLMAIRISRRSQTTRRFRSTSAKERSDALTATGLLELVLSIRDLVPMTGFRAQIAKQVRHKDVRGRSRAPARRPPLGKALPRTLAARNQAATTRGPGCSGGAQYSIQFRLGLPMFREAR